VLSRRTGLLKDDPAAETEDGASRRASFSSIGAVIIVAATRHEHGGTNMLQDYRLGLRMLLKYPGLTLAGGLALAIAIGVGAGWYDVIGKVFAPTIPLPEGDRLVTIETRNTLTNVPEARVLRDFLEWRRGLQTIEDLGAYRTHTRNLVVGNTPPEPIRVAELTAAAFSTARVPPIFGRALLDADETAGGPGVVVLGYDVWQRSLGGREDAVGSIVKLGDTHATVIGVMPKGFAYPVNHDAWMPLSLRASYHALDGDAISVIGRLAGGASRQQADAEMRLFGERTAAALPATHAHLRPRVARLGGAPDDLDIAQLALRNLPALLVMAIACLSVGTLIYARTATREGEIAVRSALGATRARVMSQLFVEALVLASVAAPIGLLAADRALAWGIEDANRATGGAPFWMTPGLKLSTILYAGGLAVVSAAMLSILPALKVTRARVQPHLANLGSGGATLRFGRVWTGAMIVQVALTAVGIPVALESVNQTARKVQTRAQFPSREYVAARIDVGRPAEGETTKGFQERRAQMFEALAMRIAQEPGVVAITYTDRPVGAGAARFGEVESSAGATPAYDGGWRVSAVAPEFFEVFDRPVIAGRAFNRGDMDSGARTIIVNEAFARAFAAETGSGSPIGARLRFAVISDDDDEEAGARPRAWSPWGEIVGIVRDFGLDPDDSGNEQPHVFHAASAGALPSLVMSVRLRGNPSTLAARLPLIAATVDPRLLVHDSQPMEEWVRQRDEHVIVMVGAQIAVTALVLFLSALGIFSLVSISVSRRTREIGLRAALGATPRQVVGGILSRALTLMGSGIAAGGALLIWSLALGAGPSGRPGEDVPIFAGYLGMTAAVMLAACLLACVGPARRALGINPSDALRES
jgi:putative ABC transport system permease protein